MNRKEGQLAGARGEIDGGSKALKNAETQIAILRGKQDWPHACATRLCQYLKGFLIASPTSGDIGGRVLRNLAFLLFQNSYIFRFFSLKNIITCLDSSPSLTSFQHRFQS